MKNQKLNLLPGVTRGTLIVTFFIAMACSEQRESTRPDEPPMASAGKIKPPHLDIHTAVLTGNLPALQQHIQAGTNLNEKDPFGGSSPLITAALFNKPEAAKLLLEAGAEVNFINKDGSTALHTAAFFCRPEIVKMLLEKGADKTIKNKYGATALESVAAPFNQVKTAYDMMDQALRPLGLKLDYAYLEKTRLQMVALLK